MPPSYATFPPLPLERDAQVLALPLLDLAAAPVSLELEQGRRRRRGRRERRAEAPAAAPAAGTGAVTVGGTRSPRSRSPSLQRADARRPRPGAALPRLRCVRSSKSWPEHPALGRERRGVLRGLAADREEDDVAAECLPPAREARARHGPAAAAQAGPVLVVGRRVLLGHLEQRLGLAGEADDGIRVEPARLEVSPSVVRRAGPRRSAGRRRPTARSAAADCPPDAASTKAGPSPVATSACEWPRRTRRERLGDEAELDRVGGRLELQHGLAHVARSRAPAARPRAWARPGASRGTTICSESLLAASTSAGTPPTRTSLRKTVASEAAAGHAHHVAGGRRSPG